MTRHKIIVNPTAGRGNGARIIPDLETNLRYHGIDFDLERTQRPFHAVELAQQAATDGYGVVVAVGGDGTANEVLNGLALAKEKGHGTDVAMGVLAAGRGNDFAFGLGISPDLADGCTTLAQGQRKLIDVGWVSGGDVPDGCYFGNSVGIGFDAVVSIEALKMTRLTGFMSYLAAVFKTIFVHGKAPQVEIAFQGQNLALAALMISVMNGRRQGGAFLMSPAAANDDGLFDVCIAAEVSRARMLTLVPHFLRGTQYSQQEVQLQQTDRLTVTAVEGTLPAHCDGEIISVNGAELTFSLLPRHLEVICTLPQEAAT